MNSSKRGAVYGFKLPSLDLVRLTSFLLHCWSPFCFSIQYTNLLLCFQLIDTKSTDRKITLLHYIANVVKEKYQQVALFYNEIHYVEKAAAGRAYRINELNVTSNITFFFFFNL